MRSLPLLVFAPLLFSVACSSEGGGDATAVAEDELTSHSAVHVWVTTDHAHPLERRADLALAAPSSGVPTIDVSDDAGHRYQEVEGFGASLTDVSAWILHHELGHPQRAALLEELFSPTRGIGLRVLRQPLGASDEIVGASYSYDEGPDDPGLHHFSVAHDEAYILPLLREVLAINPGIRVIATPWSPPAWMKTNGRLMNDGNSGKLRGDAYGAFAEYLVKSVEAYEHRGVPIFAITPQNEPGQQTDYPGMDLNESAEADFVTRYLAPAMHRGHLGHVKILGFDYNFVGPTDKGRKSFPFALLDDGAARRALSGLAFHCYGGGDPSPMTLLHERHPDKELYVTECTSGNRAGVPTSHHGESIEQLIGAMRNYAKTFVTWNLVHHPDGNPHEGNGCNGCIGVVSVEPHGRVVRERDFAYLGHASKFVGPHAHRVESTTLFPHFRHASEAGGVENVAFLNKDGTRVVVAYNSADTAQTFQVRWSGRAFGYTMPPRSSATFTW